MDITRRTRSLSHEKTDATKHSILNAALTLFLNNGFSKTTIRDISHSSNLSVGTIYRYFSKKEDIFEEIARMMVNERHMVFQAGILANDQKVYEFLLNHFDKVIDSFSSSGREGVAQLILKESQHNPELRKIYFNVMFSPYLIELEKLVSIASERKEIILRCTAFEFSLLILSPIWMAMIYNSSLSEGTIVSIKNLFNSNLYALFNAKD
ncbi:TetR/AcrR family transcriptional regulator [Acinetobacter terrestris]|uniref:TetR/AcrR family transcriptional regulator n=1 Tax=Acinetobacter terrestris TaxID=2529843 RepID=UPI00103963B6|nr:TetR/AcrR family transcriptional regulator [Acinetobacter terrestris]TCB49281.1 TetR/AcrR family transcriptional regulator [Acinetobacter terrestris]